MEVSDDLYCLFSARIEHRAGTNVIEIPERELTNGDVESGRVYRVALLPSAADRERRSTSKPRDRQPPVEEGDVREVEIEGTGDQGDGIAKVDRGFVVIIPDTEPGDEVEIEIQNVYDNFAIGQVTGSDSVGP